MELEYECPICKKKMSLDHYRNGCKKVTNDEAITMVDNSENHNRPFPKLWEVHRCIECNGVEIHILIDGGKT